MTAGRVGIVFLGCGWATEMHSRVLRRFRDVDLMYASRDPARAELYRRRFGGSRSFPSYDAALDHPAADVALVATPTSSHADLTMAALRAGKHVIVEKPAFMRSADAVTVGEVAQAARRTVFVAENYYYKPIAAYLRHAIGAGELGEVRFITVNATRWQHTPGWRDDAALSGGGALFEGGVHWVSFLANIGLFVCHAAGYRVGEQAGPDRSSLVVLRYTNGAVATLAYSWELDAPLRGLRLSKVQGTEGAVTFESNGLAFIATGRRRTVRLSSGDPRGLRAMHQDFLRAIRTGAPAQFTLAHAERDLRILERVVPAAGSARPGNALPAGWGIRASDRWDTVR